MNEASWNKYKKNAVEVVARKLPDGLWHVLDNDGAPYTLTEEQFRAAFTSTEPCRHANAMPLRLCDDTWIHWCADCGAISSESDDVDHPFAPWSAPGDFTPEEVGKIRDAARSA